jgi:hypothetical protein
MTRKAFSGRSRYFAMVDGVPLDITWPPIGPDGLRIYRVMLGDKAIGQIHIMGQHSNAAVAYGDSLLGLRSVSGFHTRWDATEYILRVSGYRTDDVGRVSDQAKIAAALLEA